MTRFLAVILIVPLVFVCVAGMPNMARADYDARDYIAAPPGTDLLLWYYRYVSGNNLYSDGNKVMGNADLKETIGIFRAVHFTSIFGITADPQVLLPFGSASAAFGTGGTDVSTSGLGDAIFACTFWLYNKPESKTWFGFTQYITAPTGDYSHEKPLNLGTNRWAFKEEVGLNKGFGNGWYIDLGGSAEFYTDNTDANTSKQTLKQDPLFTGEIHISKDITKVLYVAGEYFYHNGGNEKLNGVDQNNKTESQGAQLTTGFNFAPNYQLLVQYRNDFATKNGIATQTYGARFLYAF